MVFQKTRKLWLLCAMAFALVMFLGAVADAQLAEVRPRSRTFSIGLEFRVYRWDTAMPNR